MKIQRPKHNNDTKPQHRRQSRLITTRARHKHRRFTKQHQPFKYNYISGDNIQNSDQQQAKVNLLQQQAIRSITTRQFTRRIRFSARDISQTAILSAICNNPKDGIFHHNENQLVDSFHSSQLGFNSLPSTYIKRAHVFNNTTIVNPALSSSLQQLLPYQQQIRKLSNLMKTYVTDRHIKRNFPKLRSILDTIVNGPNSNPGLTSLKKLVEAHHNPKLIKELLHLPLDAFVYRHGKGKSIDEIVLYQQQQLDSKITRPALQLSPFVPQQFKTDLLQYDFFIAKAQYNGEEVSIYIRLDPDYYKRPINIASYGLGDNPEMLSNVQKKYQAVFDKLRKQHPITTQELNHIIEHGGSFYALHYLDVIQSPTSSNSLYTSTSKTSKQNKTKHSFFNLSDDDNDDDDDDNFYNSTNNPNVCEVLNLIITTPLKDTAPISLYIPTDSVPIQQLGHFQEHNDAQICKQAKTFFYKQVYNNPYNATSAVGGGLTYTYLPIESFKHLQQRSTSFRDFCQTRFDVKNLRVYLLNNEDPNNIDLDGNNDSTTNDYYTKSIGDLILPSILHDFMVLIDGEIEGREQDGNSHQIQKKQQQHFDDEFTNDGDNDDNIDDGRDQSLQHFYLSNNNDGNNNNNNNSNNNTNFIKHSDNDFDTNTNNNNNTSLLPISKHKHNNNNTRKLFKLTKQQILNLQHTYSCIYCLDQRQDMNSNIVATPAPLLNLKDLGPLAFFTIPERSVTNNTISFRSFIALADNPTYPIYEILNDWSYSSPKIVYDGQNDDVWNKKSKHQTAVRLLRKQPCGLVLGLDSTIQNTTDATDITTPGLTATLSSPLIDFFKFQNYFSKENLISTVGGRLFLNNNTANNNTENTKLLANNNNVNSYTNNPKLYDQQIINQTMLYNKDTLASASNNTCYYTFDYLQNMIVNEIERHIKNPTFISTLHHIFNIQLPPHTSKLYNPQVQEHALNFFVSPHLIHQNAILDLLLVDIDIIQITGDKNKDKKDLVHYNNNNNNPLESEEQVQFRFEFHLKTNRRWEPILNDKEDEEDGIYTKDLTGNGNRNKHRNRSVYELLKDGFKGNAIDDLNSNPDNIDVDDIDGLFDDDGINYDDINSFWLQPQNKSTTIVANNNKNKHKINKKYSLLSHHHHQQQQHSFFNKRKKIIPTDPIIFGTAHLLLTFDAKIDQRPFQRITERLALIQQVIAIWDKAKYQKTLKYVGQYPILNNGELEMLPFLPKDGYITSNPVILLKEMKNRNVLTWNNLQLFKPPLQITDQSSSSSSPQQSLLEHNKNNSNNNQLPITLQTTGELKNTNTSDKDNNNNNNSLSFTPQEKYIYNKEHEHYVKNIMLLDNVNNQKQNNQNFTQNNKNNNSNILTEKKHWLTKLPEYLKLAFYEHLLLTYGIDLHNLGDPIQHIKLTPAIRQKWLTMLLSSIGYRNLNHMNNYDFLKTKEYSNMSDEIKYYISTLMDPKQNELFIFGPKTNITTKPPIFYANTAKRYDTGIKALNNMLSITSKQDNNYFGYIYQPFDHKIKTKCPLTQKVTTFFINTTNTEPLLYSTPIINCIQFVESLHNYIQHTTELLNTINNPKKLKFFQHFLKSKITQKDQQLLFQELLLLPQLEQLLLKQPNINNKNNINDDDNINDNISDYDGTTLSEDNINDDDDDDIDDDDNGNDNNPTSSSSSSTITNKINQPTLFTEQTLLAQLLLTLHNPSHNQPHRKSDEMLFLFDNLHSFQHIIGQLLIDWGKLINKHHSTLPFDHYGLPKQIENDDINNNNTSWKKKSKKNKKLNDNNIQLIGPLNTNPHAVLDNMNGNNISSDDYAEAEVSLSTTNDNDTNTNNNTNPTKNKNEKRKGRHINLKEQDKTSNKIVSSSTLLPYDEFSVLLDNAMTYGWSLQATTNSIVHYQSITIPGLFFHNAVHDDNDGLINTNGSDNNQKHIHKLPFSSQKIIDKEMNKNNTNTNKNKQNNKNDNESIENKNNINLLPINKQYYNIQRSNLIQNLTFLRYLIPFHLLRVAISVYHKIQNQHYTRYKNNTNALLNSDNTRNLDQNLSIADDPSILIPIKHLSELFGFPFESIIPILHQLRQVRFNDYESIDLSPYYITTNDINYLVYLTSDNDTIQHFKSFIDWYEEVNIQKSSSDNNNDDIQEEETNNNFNKIIYTSNVATNNNINYQNVSEFKRVQYSLLEYIPTYGDGESTIITGSGLSFYLIQSILQDTYEKSIINFNSIMNNGIDYNNNNVTPATTTPLLIQNPYENLSLLISLNKQITKQSEHLYNEVLDYYINEKTKQIEVIKSKKTDGIDERVGDRNEEMSNGLIDSVDNNKNITNSSNDESNTNNEDNNNNNDLSIALPLRNLFWSIPSITKSSLNPLLQQKHTKDYLIDHTKRQQQLLNNNGIITLINPQRSIPIGSLLLSRQPLFNIKMPYMEQYNTLLYNEKIQDDILLKEKQNHLQKKIKNLMLIQQQQQQNNNNNNEQDNNNNNKSLQEQPQQQKQTTTKILLLQQKLKELSLQKQLTNVIQKQQKYLHSISKEKNILSTTYLLNNILCFDSNEVYTNILKNTMLLSTATRNNNNTNGNNNKKNQLLQTKYNMIEKHILDHLVLSHNNPFISPSSSNSSNSTTIMKNMNELYNTLNLLNNSINNRLILLSTQFNYVLNNSLYYNNIQQQQQQPNNNNISLTTTSQSLVNNNNKSINNTPPPPPPPPRLHFYIEQIDELNLFNTAKDQLEYINPFDIEAKRILKQQQQQQQNQSNNNNDTLLSSLRYDGLLGSSKRGNEVINSIVLSLLTPLTPHRHENKKDNYDDDNDNDELRITTTNNNNNLPLLSNISQINSQEFVIDTATTDLVHNTGGILEYKYDQSINAYNQKQQVYQGNDIITTTRTTNNTNRHNNVRNNNNNNNNIYNLVLTIFDPKIASTIDNSYGNNNHSSRNITKM